MIEFQWDERKTRRNEREHGISFRLAQAALETGLGIPVTEQFRQGEWRTNIVVPLRGVLLITVTIATYHGEEDEDISAGSDEDEETEQPWSGGGALIRIISARESTLEEQRTYFQSRPPFPG